MKGFLKTSLVAAVLAIGAVSGCDVTVNSRPEPRHQRADYDEPAPRTVVYTESAPRSYWVHERSVYGRDRSGNFYVYEGNKRGEPIRDSKLIIRIQKEGRQHNDYPGADRDRSNRQPDRSRRHDQRDSRERDSRQR